MRHTPPTPRGDNGEGIPSSPPYLHPDRWPCSCPAPPPPHRQHQPRSTTVPTTSTEEQTPPRHTHLPARLYLYTTRGRRTPQERTQYTPPPYTFQTAGAHRAQHRGSDGDTLTTTAGVQQEHGEQEITVYSSMPGWYKSRKQRLRPYRLDSVAGSIPHPLSKQKQNRSKRKQSRSKKEHTGNRAETEGNLKYTSHLSDHWSPLVTSRNRSPPAGSPRSPATWSKPCNGKPWKVLPTEDLQTAHEVNGRAGRGPRCWKVLHSQERQPDRRRR